MLENAIYGCCGTTCKQMFYINHSGKREGVLVGVNNGRVRLRYPTPTKSRVQYLDVSTNDLKCLCALLVAGLVPAGVVADKLEEELPVHTEAARILRKWGEIRSR